MSNNSKSNDLFPELISFEINYLDTRSGEHLDSIDVICRQLKRQLRSDDNVYDINVFPKSSVSDLQKNSRNTYEDKRLLRFEISISYGLRNRDALKKGLEKICSNNQFSNTLLSLNGNKFDLIKFLSKIDSFIPRQTFKDIESFSFGTIIELNTFVRHYTTGHSDKTLKLNVAKGHISADFKHDQKRFDLYFSVTSGGHNGKKTQRVHYKLEYSYESIDSMIVSLDERLMKIHFILSHPPIVSHNVLDVMSSEEKDSYHQRGQKYQKRFKNYKSNDNIDSDVKEWQRIDDFYGCKKDIIGNSNALVLEIPVIRNEFKALNTKGKSEKKLEDPFRLLFLFKLIMKKEIHFSHINSQTISDELQTKYISNNISNHFPLQYAFDSVFSHSFRASDELILNNRFKEFNQKVIQLSKRNIDCIEETLFELSSLINRNAVFSTLRALEEIFEKNYPKYENNFNIKSFDNTVNIRRVILTPTRLILFPPLPTLKSRFLHTSDPEYSIRVAVREEDEKSIELSMRNSDSPEVMGYQKKFLKRIMKESLLNGIKIGNRLFEFLGMSSSQMRDIGVIMYAKDTVGRTAQSIRDSIGNITDPKDRRNPGKYAVRLGLAFSSVQTHIDVAKCQTEVIDDIKGGVKLDENDEPTKETYTFSDGIGRVSKSIMERIYSRLWVHPTYKPSAIQIRYGGCKGMLVLDPTLKGEKIVFRKSMKKFDSEATQLGVIKLSAPRPLYLNRQLITILEQMGVKPKVFLEMLLNDLKLLANSLLCECSAKTLFQNYSALNIPYQKLYESGIPFLSEPMFRQIIDSVVNQRINELLEKARIKVPYDYGRSLFGVLDETATLEYGEIFLQLSEVDSDGRPTGEMFVVVGEVMVTKFPCMHPGDVRKLKAVDVPQLHHIYDCLVFPQKGVRPHPDEMAGSDLDGDEYAIIYNKSKLIFKRENYKPMNFPTNESILLDRDVTIDDILEFFCNYVVCGCNVGLVANAHLARADNIKINTGNPDNQSTGGLNTQSPNQETETETQIGIFSPICLSLAKKYSIALDFTKTGRIEPMKWNEKPFNYPDFMEKFEQKRTYLSRQVLGQLYRHCDIYRLGMHSNRKPDEPIVVSPNPRFELKGWEKYRQSATEAYNEYKLRIDYLLTTYGLEEESALISGAFSKTRKYMTGRTESLDVKELLRDIINKLFYELKQKFNKECFGTSEEEQRLRASAWYLIPYKVTDNTTKRYFGFSWTITEEICKLLSYNPINSSTNGEHNCLQLAIDLMDDYINKNFIYKDPDIDDSIYDLSDRRQMVMEKRCYSAEVVLRAWLERQDHLFYKRRVNKRIISSTDSILSDMERKLRRKFCKIRLRVMSEAKDTIKPLKTVGYLVMSYMKEFVDEWLDISSLDQNNRVVTTPLVKLGFSALISLNHFSLTKDISHIITVNKRWSVSIRAPLKLFRYYIPLPTPESYQKFVERLVQYPEEFEEQIKRMSGAIDVVMEPYRINTKKLQFYYQLTAYGTVWSRQIIKNFICHPSFFWTVANTDQKKELRKKNLLCNGSNFRHIPINNDINLE